MAELNAFKVKFREETRRATDADHDRRTDVVIAEIQKSGEAFFGGSTWRGKRAMRVSVCNWQTSDDDVDRVVAAARQAIVSASRRTHAS